MHSRERMHGKRESKKQKHDDSLDYDISDIQSYFISQRVNERIIAHKYYINLFQTCSLQGMYWTRPRFCDIPVVINILATTKSEEEFDLALQWFIPFSITHETEFEQYYEEIISKLMPRLEEKKDNIKLLKYLIILSTILAPNHELKRNHVNTMLAEHISKLIEDYNNKELCQAFVWSFCFLDVEKIMEFYPIVLKITQFMIEEEFYLDSNDKQDFDLYTRSFFEKLFQINDEEPFLYKDKLIEMLLESDSSRKTQQYVQSIEDRFTDDFETTDIQVHNPKNLLFASLFNLDFDNKHPSYKIKGTYCLILKDMLCWGYPKYNEDSRKLWSSKTMEEKSDESGDKTLSTYVCFYPFKRTIDPKYRLREKRRKEHKSRKEAMIKDKERRENE